MYGGLVFQSLHEETECNHENRLSELLVSVKDFNYSAPEYEAGVNQYVPCSSAE
jgi:hypothetical protein